MAYFIYQQQQVENWNAKMTWHFFFIFTLQFIKQLKAKRSWATNDVILYTRWNNVEQKIISFMHIKWYLSPFELALKTKKWLVNWIILLWFVLKTLAQRQTFKLSRLCFIDCVLTRLPMHRITVQIAGKWALSIYYKNNFCLEWVFNCE